MEGEQGEIKARRKRRTTRREVVGEDGGGGGEEREGRVRSGDVKVKRAIG
jgi:hypothetical protein